MEKGNDAKLHKEIRQAQEFPRANFMLKIGSCHILRTFAESTEYKKCYDMILERTGEVEQLESILDDDGVY